MEVLVKQPRNLNDYLTKEDLEDEAAYGLVVFSDPEDENEPAIPRSPINPDKKRAAVLLDFVASFRRRELELVIGVFDVDNSGNPIQGKGIHPYEDSIKANNNFVVDVSDPLLPIVPKEEWIENYLYYMGEFDAYVYFIKNNDVRLLQLFANNIARSKRLLEG